MYQNIGKTAFKKDLTNTYALLEELGNPHLQGKHIHVTGSNGKGSVCSMIASILTEAGHKVGLYTSPHLLDYTERVRINGVPMEKDYVVDFVGKMDVAIQKIKPSFFELTVAMAFDYFAQKQTNVNVIEVGLGGRLDSTNVILPILSVITNISLEHTDMLGETLGEIAFEKAGIIKQNTPVVIGEWTKETLKVFESNAKELHAKVTLASNTVSKEWQDACELKGLYQRKNLNTLQSVVDNLGSLGWQLKEIEVLKGLRYISKNSGLLGRWQTVEEEPKVILDTAHNAAGFENLIMQLNEMKYENLHVVLGVVKDKDFTKLSAVLPAKAMYYTCKPSVVRGLESEILHSKMQNNGFNSTNGKTALKALEMAKKNAGSEDLILVTGSNFVVADALRTTKYDPQ